RCLSRCQDRDNEQRWLFRVGDAATWAVASVEGGGAFRRHAALSAADRRLVVAAPAGPDDPQRAGDESACRPVAPARAPYRTGRAARADHRRLARRTARVGSRQGPAGAADRSGEAIGRDARPTGRAAILDVADAMTTRLE